MTAGSSESHIDSAGICHNSSTCKQNMHIKLHRPKEKHYRRKVVLAPLVFATIAAIANRICTSNCIGPTRNKHSHFDPSVLQEVVAFFFGGVAFFFGARSCWIVQGVAFFFFGARSCWIVQGDAIQGLSTSGE